MDKYRIVKTFSFWRDPIVLEEMTPEDKYFYLFLLTNTKTTQIGIYQITKNEMALELGYSIERIQALLSRFEEHFQLVKYNTTTREIAIKNWGVFNLNKGGKPVMDCIRAELQLVQDRSLIPYVSKQIASKEIRSLYETFYNCEEEENLIHNETKGEEEKRVENDTVCNHDTKEIVQFWDNNGFGLSNLYAKERLLSLLEEKTFQQPKDAILKALSIASANNKRKLNYVLAILKNWENSSLVTINQINETLDKPNRTTKVKKPNDSPTGRAIPHDFVLDLSAGETK
ncbi:DnaD domain protein [Metabacillus sp. HB246100]